MSVSLVFREVTCFATILPDTDPINIRAGSDAADADWFNLSDLPPLAFDHKQVIQTVVEKFLSPQQD